MNSRQDTKRFSDNVLKVLIVVFLSSFSVWLISYYTMVVQKEMFYTHFMYIPAILSSFWWGKRGSVNAFFLGFFLIMSDLYAGAAQETMVFHVTQIFVFFVVALMAGVLSDDKKRFEEQLKEAIQTREEFIEAASHYYMNPITIAKGYLGVLMKECESEVARQYATKIKEAIERIEEVVVNTIEGKIYEKKGDVTLRERPRP